MNLKIIILIALVVFTSACSVKRDIDSRIMSPDGRIDALISKVEGNATVGFAYHVYLVSRSGAMPPSDEAVLVADQAKDLKLQWNKDKELTIQCHGCRVFKFTNFWVSKNVDNFNYKVQIHLDDSQTAGT